MLEQGADQRGNWWRSWLGVMHTSLRPGHAAYETVKQGSLVTRVVEGSPAAAAGLQVGNAVLIGDLLGLDATPPVDGLAERLLRLRGVGRGRARSAIMWRNPHIPGRPVPGRRAGSRPAPVYWRLQACMPPAAVKHGGGPRASPRTARR